MDFRWLFVIVLAASLMIPTMLQIQHVKAATTRNFTLYGHYVHGWGFTAGNISSPGPTIVVEQGDTVNLTLINNDGVATHRFFLSYTNATSPTTGDPESLDFATMVNYQFVASNTIGTYTYRCFYHSGTMFGYFQIVATGTIPEFQPLTLLSLLITITAALALMLRRKRQNH